MAVGSASEADIGSLVVDRFEYLEKAGRIGYFQNNAFYEKILKNEAPGGGDKIRLPITIGEPTVTVTSNTLIATSQSAVDTFKDLTFDYQQVYTDRPISLLSMKRIGNGGGARAYLDRVIENAVEGLQKKVNNGVWNADGSDAATFFGIQNFWYGATYGDLTRSSYSAVLGTNSAYDATTSPALGGGGSEPTRSQTYWDCNALGNGDPAMVVKLIKKAIIHVSEPNTEPDFVVVGKDIYEMCLEHLDNKTSSVNMGIARSITPEGKESLKIRGAELVYDSAMPSETAYVLNSRYLFVPTVDGFSLSRIKPDVVQSTGYNRATELQFLASGRIVTDCVTRHAWLADIL